MGRRANRFVDQGWGQGPMMLDEYGRMVRGYGFDDDRPRRPQAPPPKPVPNKAQIDYDFSSRHKRREYRSTLRLDSAQAVHDAILVFGGERAGAFDETARQVGESHGGMAAAMFLLAMPRSGGSFASRVAAEALATVDTERGYRGDWDYDGPGPFHKCNIQAKREDDGSYSLHIYAAYVGNRPEIRLGQRIGAPVGFSRVEVECLWAPVEGSDRFRVPLADLEAIHAVLGVPFDAEAFLARLAAPTMLSWDPTRVEHPFSTVPLLEDGGVHASLAFINYRAVALYERREKPDRDYAFRIEDGFLTGPARIDHRFERPQSVGMEVVIGSKGLTYDTALEARCMELADKVCRAVEGRGLPDIELVES